MTGIFISHISPLDVEIQWMAGYILIFFMVIFRRMGRNGHRWFLWVKSKVASSGFKRRHIDDSANMFLICNAAVMATQSYTLPLAFTIILNVAVLSTDKNILKISRWMVRRPFYTQVIESAFIIAGIFFPCMLAFAFVIETLDTATLFYDRPELLEPTLKTKPFKIMSFPSFSAFVAIIVIAMALIYAVFGYSKTIVIISASVASLLVALALVRGGSKNDDHV